MFLRPVFGSLYSLTGVNRVRGDTGPNEAGATPSYWLQPADSPAPSRASNPCTFLPDPAISG